MRKLSLHEQLEAKHYYRNLYRRLLKWNQYSVQIMMVLVLVIIKIYLSEDAPEYFATNSASSIKKLTPLDAPNESSEALLAPDLPGELGKKTLRL